MATLMFSRGALKMSINICEVERCDRVAELGAHHIKLKSRGGKDGPTMRVCFECHRAITDHIGEWTRKYRQHSWQSGDERESDERT